MSRGVPPRVLPAVLVLVSAIAACAPTAAGDGASTPAAPTPAASAAPTTDATGSVAPAGEVVTLTTEVGPLHPSVDGYAEERITLRAPNGGGLAIAVKVASTPAERQHGLMEVTDLPDGTGMLFVFEDERQGGFWMKNTLVPLDIAYVGADGALRSVLAMDPCTADPCPVYDPGQPYRFALEVPQGWYAANGVDTSWRLERG